jgi:hypothetical protein
MGGKVASSLRKKRLLCRVNKKVSNKILWHISQKCRDVLPWHISAHWTSIEHGFIEHGFLIQTPSDMHCATVRVPTHAS